MLRVVIATETNKLTKMAVEVRSFLSIAAETRGKRKYLYYTDIFMCMGHYVRVADDHMTLGIPFIGDFFSRNIRNCRGFATFAFASP